LQWNAKCISSTAGLLQFLALRATLLNDCIANSTSIVNDYRRRSRHVHTVNLRRKRCCRGGVDLGLRSHHRRGRSLLRSRQRLRLRQWIHLEGLRLRKVWD